MILESRLARGAFVSIFPGLTVLSAIAVYVFYNQSGHTSVNPWLFSPVFIFQLVLGVVAISRLKRRWSGVLTALCGLAGMLFLLWLDLSSTLLPYGTWIERGMP